jgi:hypothetical protein
MTGGYLEQKTLKALELAGDDWAQASKQLASWAETDMRLLLELTRDYLRGAAARAVQAAARQKNLHPQPTQKPGQKKITRLDASIWDEIITQMQTSSDMDSEQHEKALRVIAKAFLSKRLDTAIEKKQTSTGKK